MRAHTKSSPRQKSYVVTLRGGKSYDGPKKPVDYEEEEEHLVAKKLIQEDKKEDKATSNKLTTIIEVKFTPPPFSGRLANSKKER